MVQLFAKVILVMIIPVFIWIIFMYLGTKIDMVDMIKRIIALLVAALVMYRISISK